jgi:hypothetical protein
MAVLVLVAEEEYDKDGMVAEKPPLVTCEIVEAVRVPVDVVSESATELHEE